MITGIYDFNFIKLSYNWTIVLTFAFDSTFGHIIITDALMEKKIYDRIINLMGSNRHFTSSPYKLLLPTLTLL